jgi:hypothetical protein
MVGVCSTAQVCDLAGAQMTWRTLSFVCAERGARRRPLHRKGMASSTEKTLNTRSFADNRLVLALYGQHAHVQQHTNTPQREGEACDVTEHKKVPEGAS